MATKYKGVHPEIWADGYVQGVEDGENKAKAEHAAGIAEVSHATATLIAAATAKPAITEAQREKLDFAFRDGSTSSKGVTMQGAVQMFGVPMPGSNAK